MTENEAISKIQYRIDTASEIAGKGTDGKAFEDLEMAIQALEEIQAYRAIGTVEELKSMKENGAFSGVELAQICAMQMQLKEYKTAEKQGLLLRLPCAEDDAEIRADAIREFVKRLKEKSFWGYQTLEDYCEDSIECVAVEDIPEIVEQMLADMKKG